MGITNVRLSASWLTWVSVGTGGLVVAITTPTLAARQQEPAAQVLRSVGREDLGFFVFPGLPGARTRNLIALIARSARVPIGFEEVADGPQPAGGDLSGVPLAARQSLIGLTVAEALDALVSADPRYAWREQQGVFVVRPVASWNDAGHFLGHRVLSFHLEEATVSDVAELVYRRLRVPTIGGGGGTVAGAEQTASGLERALSLHLSDATVLEILNATLVAHGSLAWRVRYATVPPSAATSCIRFITFDGSFREVMAASCGFGF